MANPKSNIFVISLVCALTGPISIAAASRICVTASFVVIATRTVGMILSVKSNIVWLDIPEDNVAIVM